MRKTLVLTVAMLLAAACASGEDDAAAGAPDTGTFVAVGVDFAEAPERLAAGEVTVELINEDQIEHNVVFEDVSDEPVAAAAGGETASGTVTLEPGEHVAYCSIPGHRGSGMEVTVTVEG